MNGINKIIEQDLGFLRWRGRTLLLCIAIVAISLFQTGCNEVIDTAWILFWGEDKNSAWKRLDFPDKVNLALDSNTPNSILKAMGRDAKLLNYLLDEIRFGNKENKNDRQKVLNALARMQFPSQIYYKLYLDKDTKVRLVVACNSYSPPDILNVLANDEEKIIRVNVAWNLAATPDSTLTAMGQDTEVVNWFLSNVRTYDEENEDEWQHSMKVLWRMQLPLWTYQNLALDKNVNLRSVVACNHYSPPGLLEDLAKDKDKTVRMNVASNPVAPIDVLESLRKDPQYEVVERVHDNPTWQQYIAGTPHDKYPNVVWTENGGLRPADGYRWVNKDDPENFRVILMPHIEKNIFGNIHPADGYCWLSDDPWGKHDFRVQHIPGTPHSQYTNVVWAENDRFRPAPGYEWASNPPSIQNFRVVPISGTPHNKYPNVVWAENGNIRPAPGYEWVNKEDPEDFRVKWKGYGNDLVQRYWEHERNMRLYEAGRQYWKR